MYPLHHNDVLGMYPLYVVTSFVGYSPSRSCTSIPIHSRQNQPIFRHEKNVALGGIRTLNLSKLLHTIVERSAVGIPVRTTAFYLCPNNWQFFLLCNGCLHFRTTSLAKEFISFATSAKGLSLLVSLI